MPRARLEAAFARLAGIVIARLAGIDVTRRARREGARRLRPLLRRSATVGARLEIRLVGMARAE
jgi:hypothetical protein